MGSKEIQSEEKLKANLRDRFKELALSGKFDNKVVTEAIDIMTQFFAADDGIESIEIATLVFEESRPDDLLPKPEEKSFIEVLQFAQKVTRTYEQWQKAVEIKQELDSFLEDKAEGLWPWLWVKQEQIAKIKYFYPNKLNDVSYLRTEFIERVNKEKKIIRDVSAVFFLSNEATHNKPILIAEVTRIREAKPGVILMKGSELEL